MTKAKQGKERRVEKAGIEGWRVVDTFCTEYIVVLSRGAQMFQKPDSHLKIRGATKTTRTKNSNKDQKMFSIAKKN